MDPCSAATQIVSAVRSMKIDASDCADNYLLNLVDEQLLEAVATLECAYVRKRLTELAARVSRLTLQSASSWGDFYTTYGELEVFEYLHRRGLSPEAVPEKENEKTPDFVLRSAEPEIHIEVKSYLPEIQGDKPGKARLDEYQDRSLAAKIGIEDRIRSGRQAFGENWFRPLGDGSRSNVIESLRRKIVQNYDSRQFSRKNTALAINAKALLLPEQVRDSAMAIHTSGPLHYPASGTLWMLALGKQGWPVFSEPEFEGKENIVGTLGQDGILRTDDYKDVYAIIWFGHFQGGRIEQEGSGFFLREYDPTDKALPFLCNMAEWGNDGVNTRAFKLLREEHGAG